jgi:hypothetical protein
VKQATMFADPDPATVGLACKACGAVEAVTHWDTLPDGQKVIRMTCAACRTFLRHLIPEGGCVFQPKPTDTHAAEQRTPDSEWQWVGFVRSMDGRWRPVALSDDHGQCWDALPVRKMGQTDDPGSPGFSTKRSS